MATPKQFLAIVGDPSGEIKTLLYKQMKFKLDENILVENRYYKALVGVREYANLADLAKVPEEEARKNCAVFIRFSTMDNLAECVAQAERMRSDIRMLITGNVDDCIEADDLESWAPKHDFEMIYLVPNEDHIVTAETINEKIGVERLVESLNVCSWPERTTKIPDMISSVKNHPFDCELLRMMNEEDGEEEEYARYQLKGTSEYQTFGAFTRYFDKLLINEVSAQSRQPAMTAELQHAERIHIPDSPTNSNTSTVCNGEDVSVTVDFDLVKPVAKQAEEEKTDRVEATTELDAEAALAEKKNN